VRDGIWGGTPKDEKEKGFHHRGAESTEREERSFEVRDFLPFGEV